MAKLKAPLMSLGASGALGKALVFFPWKGIDCVREYVIPSNPDTTLQSTHRAYLTEAVAKIHELQALPASELDETDQSAYAAWGSTFPTPRTWFNQAVKNWIDVVRAGKGPIIYYHGNMEMTTATDARMQIYCGEKVVGTLVAAKAHLGTSKTNLNQTRDFTVIAGVAMNIAAGDQFTGLTVGKKYYWQARPITADPAEKAWSGIYSFIAT
ncbi:hypothetical protein ES705_30415 [subsurface metagenome]